MKTAAKTKPLFFYWTFAMGDLIYLQKALESRDLNKSL